jgi:MoaA/NifB/PqqE/SkfB family radical SAM enzyme
MPRIRRLRIGVSFDHIGNQHDKIRGQKGIHKNALALVENLKSIPDSRLTVQGNLTIAPHNINDLGEIYEYFKRLTLKTFWFPVSFSDNFYENLEKADKFSFGQNGQQLLERFVAFLRRRELTMPDYYYYSGLLKTLQLGKRSFPCSGGSKFLLVNSVGDVYPCYIIPKSYRMGSIREHTLSEIWNSEEAHRIRSLILNNTTCDLCTQWYDGYALSHSLKAFSLFILAHPVRVIKHFLRF